MTALHFPSLISTDHDEPRRLFDPHDVPRTARKREGKLRLPLTEDRLWTMAEVAYYAGKDDPNSVRSMPIPWTHANADVEGRGERLYDPKDVKAYFAARKRGAN